MQGLRSVSFQLPCKKNVLASAFVDNRSAWPGSLRSCDPALKRHRTVCFLCFNGHCYMYRCVKRVLERDAWRTLYHGEARQELPPIVEFRLHGSQGKLHGSERSGFFIRTKKKLARRTRLDFCPDGELGATQFLVHRGELSGCDSDGSGGTFWL